MADINYHFAPRQEPCKECGETDFVYRVCGKGNIVMWVCKNCGATEAVPHIENYDRHRKAASTPLMRWRFNVLKRDNHTCRICGSQDNLEAHHLVPVEFCNRTPLMFDENNGITLCKKCHEMVHGGQMLNVKK